MFRVVLGRQNFYAVFWYLCKFLGLKHRTSLQTLSTTNLAA